MQYDKLIKETKNLSILLVEDYELLRLDMAEVLENFFKTVVVAENGAEGLSEYESYYENNQRFFDIVISDIQMPIMNGVELCESIRAISPDQVIIVLSAHTESDYLLKLINIGISKFITKPVNHDMLLKTLYEESSKIQESKNDPSQMLMVNLDSEYIWNTTTQILTYKGVPVELTKHELLLLRFFLTKQEHICTGFDIIDYFYRENISINEKNIRNLVFKLRKKIPEKCIVSIYGLGYKFTLK